MEELIEPIAKPEMNLWFPQRERAFKIVFSEPLPRIIHDFGSIAVGDLVDREEVKDLEMPDLELGQYAFTPLDDVQVKVFQPMTTARYLTKRVQVFVDRMSKGRFFVFEDHNVFMTVINPTGYDIPMSRVEFTGWRHQLEELKEKPEQFVAVTTAGKTIP